MNIVIPMAGLGSRFARAGFQKPKPLIEVRGRPMYAWATDSLPLSRCARLIFVLLTTQPELPELQRDILKRYALHRPVILTVPSVTAGQAVTVLRAKELVDNDDPLLIHNSDTAFDADASWVDQARAGNLDGALLVFESQEPRWSFSRENADGWVEEVREKEVISTWATTGTYWFRRGARFVQAAESRLRSGKREASEYYVGPLYNDLIARGARVKNFPVSKLYCFGTPEDLASTLKDLADK